MELIVLVDKNWAIGYKGDQIVRIKQDLEHFRQLTLNQTVIYGRKTLATFPGGKPLEGRTNWIMTRNPNLQVEGAEIMNEFSATLAKAASIERSGEKVYVIGGATIYEQFLPYCSAAEVTMADRVWPADVYFPNLLEIPGWAEVSRSEPLHAGVKSPFTYQFVRFENSKVLPY